VPLRVPELDSRTYQDLLDQALARIPVHTPEWTSFSESDPGMTLIEVFAFLTDSLLYRAKQIPERNRLKFLSLLGVPLLPAAAAQGLVSFANVRGPDEAVYLSPGFELRSGSVPFRTVHGVEVLPVEAQVFVKRRVQLEAPLRQQYELLYASFKDAPDQPSLGFYETAQLPPPGAGGIDLEQTVDRCLWLALMLREGEDPARLPDVRRALQGRTLSLGIVPTSDAAGLSLVPAAAEEAAASWSFELPRVLEGGLPSDPALRDAQYQTLATVPAPRAPTVIELSLPAADALRVWTDLLPTEAGVRNFPPSLEDKKQNDRVVTWIRVRPSVPPRGNVLWLGINAARVSQRARVVGEILGEGSGEPDQKLPLASTPVLPDNFQLTVDGEPWQVLDDLGGAGPEVSVPDPRLPPGTPLPAARPSRVYRLDAEAGEVTFGDGLRGARPARDARIVADYDTSHGRAGNVPEGAIKAGPNLPAGFRVRNPIATWGGADAEQVSDGEKQIARHLQHRDRLVTAADFEALALRTPSVPVARVDVLPAFHPELSLEPGDAAGAVTLMLIPRYDPRSPEAPVADESFLRAVAEFLEPRRLVTTEVVLRSATYVPIWVSIGVKLVPGAVAAQVTRAVEQAVRAFLSPLPERGSELDERSFLASPDFARRRRGWPLRQAVYPQEIAAAVSRVEGVAWVNEVRLSDGGSSDDQPLPMVKLQLPRLERLSVSIGAARPVAELRGDQPAVVSAPRIVPVPVIPEEC
jgi:hypothetical protein